MFMFSNLLTLVTLSDIWGKLLLEDHGAGSPSGGHSFHQANSGLAMAWPRLAIQRPLPAVAGYGFYQASPSLAMAWARLAIQGPWPHHGGPWLGILAKLWPWPGLGLPYKGHGPQWLAMAFIELAMQGPWPAMAAHGWES